MEKDYRLFVKNLPLNINEERLKNLFGKYVTIKNIDLKEKKDLDEKINKFAFINITATDKSLNTCFVNLNGERIDGFQISVELAKESFLERLKRERNENKLKNEASTAQTNFESPKCITFNSAHVTAKSKRHTFSDADLESIDLQNKNLEENVKENKEDKDKNAYIRKDENDQNGEESEASIDLDKCKKRILDVKNFNSTISNSLEANKKLKTIKFNSPPNENKIINKPLSKDIFEEKVISESEKKRLLSLKQKRREFNTQKQTICNALRFVDNKSNNKIVFDDDINFESSEKKVKYDVNKKNNLFDSDDEDQEKYEWNEDELDAKANIKNKLLKIQTNIGNDKRFVLDERFLDDEDKVDVKKKEENVDDQSELDEKKWQLNILGNVLGKSITTSDEHKASEKKNKMIRYDPLASNHKDYELIIEKPKEEKPKKKRKTSVTDIKEEIPIPKSDEVFYDVSEKLVESLKQNEGFSLLKAFGRDTSHTDDSKKEIDAEVKESEGNFQFNFNAKNPFKYDSSDDENDTKETNKNDTLPKSNTTEFSIFSKINNTLFFAFNDSRFEEAKHFFKTLSADKEDTFKHRRRELKEIVRSKVRNNMKKTIPWNRKRVRKVQKKS